MSETNTSNTEPDLTSLVESHDAMLQPHVQFILESVRDVRRDLRDALDVDKLVEHFAEGEVRDKIKQSVVEYRDQLKSFQGQNEQSEAEETTSEPEEQQTEETSENTEESEQSESTEPEVAPTESSDDGEEAASEPEPEAPTPEKYTLKETGIDTAKSAGAVAGVVTLAELVAAFGPGVLSVSSTAVLGGAAALVGGSVYGLGRLEGKLRGLEKTGALKNFGRGIRGLVTIPAFASYYAFKKLKVGSAAKANLDASKNIVTGKSPAVKAVTSPVWWTVHSVGGVGRGFMSGVKGNSSLKEAKGMKKVGHAIGATVRSPYSAARWLFARSESSSTST